jgi:hypothetical protein
MARTNDTTPTFETYTTDALLDALCIAADNARLATTDQRWLNAIASAFNWLLEVDSFEYCATTHTLKIESLDVPGRFYEANGRCTCAAAAHNKPCVHRAAARLIHRALEVQATMDEAEDAATAATEGPITVTPIDPSAEIRALAAELRDDILRNNPQMDEFDLQDACDAQAQALVGDILRYAAAWDASAHTARTARPMALAA